MDSLTQAALGAAVGELLLGRKLGWRGAAWGALIGTLPDLDVVVLPFLDEAAGIRWHRGISHSLLLMVLAPLLLAWPIARLHAKREISVFQVGWMVFWVWSTHVLIDVFTTYGTQIYEPFSDRRVALGNLFIIDPLFTLPLLVGLVVALVHRVGSARRGAVMRRAIWCAGLYVVFSLGMKGWAMREMEARLARDVPGAELVAVSPTTFNTILWRGLAEEEDGYHVFYWSPFDGDEGEMAFVPKKRELVASFAGEDILEALQWFSRGHWAAREAEEGVVVFIDMRFGEIQDGSGAPARPVFQWHLQRKESGQVTAPTMRPADVDYGAAMGLIWQRMWGNQTRWNSAEAY